MKKYAFEPLPDGSGVYVSLFYDNKPVSQFFVKEEFSEFLGAALKANSDAKLNRDDKRLQALGYTSISAVGGGGGAGLNAGGLVGGYGRSGERRKKAHEVIAEERDRIFKEYGIK